LLNNIKNLPEDVHSCVFCEAAEFVHYIIRIC
jgi:hypothetical protein